MKVAIVGGGIAGLSAYWTLSLHSDHEVDIFEAADWWGGHAHTARFERPGFTPCEVDTGFVSRQIIYNPKTYPNFVKFLKTLGVEELDSSMTFSVSRDNGKFEWGSRGLRGLFCQKRNFGAHVLFDPYVHRLRGEVYRMFWDIVRFNLFATDVIRYPEHPHSHLTLGEYAAKERYSDAFVQDYLLPLTAAIWSVPEGRVALEFPIMTLVRYYHNHGLLQIFGIPTYRTIQGGAVEYINKLLDSVPREQMYLNKPISGVQLREDGKIHITDAYGVVGVYDHVIMATHTDVTLKLLQAGGGASREEELILGACQWTDNHVILHFDERFMPKNKAAHGAWNYMTKSKDDGETLTGNQAMSLTFDSNVIQSLPKSCGPVRLTLNPMFRVDPSKVIGQWTYSHPILSPQLDYAQSRLDSIQRVRGLSFVGGWTGYGFHEDAFTSGMRAAIALGNVDMPWDDLRPVDREVRRPTVLKTIGRSIVATVEKMRSKEDKGTINVGPRMSA